MDRFDRFASSASRLVAHAWFFCTCVVIVVVWAPTILLLRDLDLWQLIINTLTTIVTFLLVALLQNDQRQFEVAVHAKLDAIASGVAGVPGADRDGLLGCVGAEETLGTDG